MSTRNSSKNTRRRRTVDDSDTDLYSCKLCQKTVLYQTSIRRHLFLIHRVEGNMAEANYELQRVHTFDPSTSTPAPASDQIPTDPPGQPSQAQCNGKRKMDVACEAPCLECSKWKKRAEELEKFLDDVLRNGRKTKATLEKTENHEGCDE